MTRSPYAKREEALEETIDEDEVSEARVHKIILKASIWRREKKKKKPFSLKNKRKIVKKKQTNIQTLVEDENELLF